jgi:hypothetical protein
VIDRYLVVLVDLVVIDLVLDLVLDLVDRLPLEGGAGQGWGDTI